MSRERCSGCGLELDGGTAACQVLFETITTREYADARYAGQDRLLVDTYCLQHPDRYCVSAKSLAAHLTGLCVAFEHRGQPTLLRALQRALDGDPGLVKPPLPGFWPTTTVRDILAAPDPAAYVAVVERAAREAWDGYRALHPVARGWVRDVLRPDRDAPTARDPRVDASAPARG